MPGVEVFDRYAERYDAWFERHPHHYESELRTKICFLNDVETALKEAYRALRGPGTILTGPQSCMESIFPRN